MSAERFPTTHAHDACTHNPHTRRLTFLARAVYASSWIGVCSVAAGEITEIMARFAKFAARVPCQLSHTDNRTHAAPSEIAQMEGAFGELRADRRAPQRHRKLHAEHHEPVRQ